MMDMLGKLMPMPNMPQPAAIKQAREASEQLIDLRNRDVKRRKSREQMWQLNMSMVLGNQWVGWSGTNVQTLAAPSWRIQAVDNKLFVRVRSKMARLTSDMTPTCIPETVESIDVRRAKYKEKLLNHIRRETGDFMLRFRAAQWLVTCGEVYTEAYWDESAGDTYAIDGGAVSEGDVRVRIWDPFAVWPGSGASAGNNGGRIWTADLVPVDLARLKYNDNAISPDANKSTDMKLRAQMDSFFNSGGAKNNF